MKKWTSWMVVVLFILVGITGCGKAVTRENVKSSKDTVEFRPPKGSSIDKRGFIVDPEGNVFDREGGWQIPEGGHVDAQGRIYDKNGKVMGGGATLGSKG